MWVAEMDFGIAPAVREALQWALDETLTGYPTKGLAEEVGAAAREFWSDTFKWEVAPEAVGVASDVLSVFKAAMSLLPEGAPVVVPTPAYMPFLFMPAWQGHPAVEVRSLLGEDGHYRLDLAGIAEAFQGGAGLLVLCNPWNPVGKCVGRDEFAGIETILERNPEVLVFSDEIHSPLVLEGEFHPFAEYSPLTKQRTVSATAASKGWNIPGLHCAQWVVPDPELREKLATPLKIFASGATPWGMYATVAAYRDSREWIQEVKAQIVANRETVREWLEKEPKDTPSRLTVHLPEATYLSWWETDGEILGPSPAKTLQEAGLIVNDGADLGRGFDHAFRLNLATTPEALAASLKIIETQFASERARD